MLILRLVSCVGMLKVLRIELVGTGVSGRKAGALHAICLANAIDAVKCESLCLCMRVNDRASS